MKKEVVWDSPKIASTARKPGTYGSYQEFLQKSNAFMVEQEQAMEYLKKAFPAMEALLKYKLEHGEPLVVMRPLRYQTSEILKSDSIDDNFYNPRGLGREKVNDKFVDVVKTIMPGTQLMLKSLDMSLQEFVFTDALDNEHAINFADKPNLMTQTNIFEEVRSFLEIKGV